MSLVVSINQLSGKPVVVEGKIPVESVGLTDGDYIQFTQPIDVKAKVYLADDTVVAQVDVRSRFQTFDYRSLQEIEKDWDSHFTLDITVEPGAEKVDIEEGCLSIPGIYGNVRRPKKVTVEAYTADGKKIKFIDDGWIARVAQHEIDHTNGILIIDLIKKYTQGEDKVKEWKEKKLI
jgi:peptide deformylase